MGINRNLLSIFIKSKLKPLSSSSSYSSDPCHIFRRFLSAAAPSLSDGKTHAPTLDDDLTKPMFLIQQRLEEGCRNYYLLSAAADDDDGSSWKDHLHPISSPFSSEHLLFRGCKEWTLFFDNELMKTEADSYQRRISLWNPITKRIHNLAPCFLPRPRPKISIEIECFGFGFEPKSQDYKFIRFLHAFLSDSYGERHIEMYSLKTDSWKPITATTATYPPIDTGTIPLDEPSVCVNGVYYWVAIGGLSSSGFSILSFDFADEKFSLIRLPKAAEPRGTTLRGYLLAEFHGSLAILVHSDPIKEADEPFWFEVQVRRAKRWRSVLKVTIGDDVLAGDRVFNVLGLFQNDYLFLQGYNKGELMIFNVKTSKLENLGIYAGLANMLSIFPFFVPT